MLPLLLLLSTFSISALAQLPYLPSLNDSVSTLALSGTNLFIATTFDIHQFNAESEQWIRSFEFPYHGHGPFSSIKANDAYVVAVMGERVFQFRASTGEFVRSFHAHQYPCLALELTRDFIYTGGEDDLVKQWDIVTGELVRVFSGHKAFVKSVAVFGNYLFSGDYAGFLNQWDITTGALLKSKEAHPGMNAITTLVVQQGHPDQPKLYSGSWDKMIKVWDVETLELELEWSTEKWSARALLFHGHHLYMIGYGTWPADQNFVIIQMNGVTGYLERIITEQETKITSLVSMGDYVISSSWGVSKWCGGNQYQRNAQCFMCPSTADQCPYTQGERLIVQSHA